MGRAYCARKTTLPTRSFPILAGGQFGELYYLGQGLLDYSPCGLEAAWYLWAPSWGAPWGGTLSTTKDRQAVVSHDLGPMWPAEVPT